MVRQKCHFLFVHQQHLNLNVYIIVSVLAGGILIRNDEIISCELLKQPFTVKDFWLQQEAQEVTLCVC